MSRPHTPSAWTGRIIVGREIGTVTPSDWFAAVYRDFRRTVLSKGYPCFFGEFAERQGDIAYSFVEERHLDHLPETLGTFLEWSASKPERRNNLVVFFQESPTPLTHADYRARFWRTLQFLHDHDPQGPAVDVPSDPYHHMWEFSFAGKLLFVVGASPSHLRRRSRNLGPSMVMLFQPRDVFYNKLTGEPISDDARAFVRARLRRWDEADPYAGLGNYGDADNLEWHQYFLPEDDAPVHGRCPLMIRSGAVEAHEGAAAPDTAPAGASDEAPDRGED